MSAVISKVHCRSLIAQLLIAALVLQALIPSGFMPDTGRDGSLSLRLCSGIAPLAAAGGDNTERRGGSGDHDDSGGSGPCPFWGALHVAVPGAVFAQLAPVARALAVALPAWGAAYSSAISHFRLPRGPPVRL